MNWTNLFYFVHTHKIKIFIGHKVKEMHISIQIFINYFCIPFYYVIMQIEICNFVLSAVGIFLFIFQIVNFMKYSNSLEFHSEKNISVLCIQPRPLPPQDYLKLFQSSLPKEFKSEVCIKYITFY